MRSVAAEGQAFATPTARLCSLSLKLGLLPPISLVRSCGGQAIERLGVGVGQHIREYAVTGWGHRIWCRSGSIRVAFDLRYPD
ncbi:hypothetical protein AERO8C_20337 [Aeromonas veronii]|uniref:Uncharacterized protein n=1 Tax=Aeromonas veronii TaxID=654 RepID=A0A653L2B3_AERVE|nr:hypothetical protein AERO8C_20337 [Aeromonas veronii]